MDDSKVKAPDGKRRRAASLGPYVFSLLIIIIPAVTAYYFVLQSQTDYHQKRAFRALDEAGRLLDRNVAAFGKLHPKKGLFTASGTNQDFNADEKEPPEKTQQKLTEYAGKKQINPAFSDYKLISLGVNQTCSERVGFIRDKKDIKLVKISCPSKDKETSGSSSFHYKSTVSISPLLAELRRRREFDVIALATPDGDVIYSSETERSGLFSSRPSDGSVSRTKHYHNIKHLLEQANCQLKQQGNNPDKDVVCNNSILGQAAFIEVEVGDATKLVFIQPYRPQENGLFCDYSSDDCKVGGNPETGGVTVASGGGDPDTKSATGYMIGIVDAGRFRKRVQQISPNMVAGSALFMLIALLLAPYLRIALGGPLLSVSRLFAGYLLSAGILSTGITIILILWATLGRSILEVSESTAEQLAKNIEIDVRDELGERLSLYERLTAKMPVFSTLRPESSGGSSMDKETLNKNGDQGNVPCLKNPEIGDIENRPPYRVLFFLDESGESVSTHNDCNYFFDYRDKPIESVNVAGRDYFKQANKHGLLLNKLEGGEALPTFAIERIMSYSTGSPSTALAIPEGGGGLPGKFKVGVISGPLQSLSAPVLPLGFHFAIIEDETGLVVAHDNAGRVLVENFYREADDNPGLIASVKHRQSNGVHGKYHGHPSFFYTRAIEGLPWSVVVIHDKTLVQTVRLEIAAMALGELFFIFMVVASCIVATIVFWRRLPWTWLWPMRRRVFDENRRVFWAALIVLPLVLLAGIGVICTFSGASLVFWTVVVVLCGAHLMYLVSIQPYDVILLQRRKWRTPPFILLILVLSLLVLAGSVENGERINEAFSLRDPRKLCLSGVLPLILLTFPMPLILTLLWGTKTGNCDSPDSPRLPGESLRRFRHVMAGVLCLLIFGGLPAGAAFKDAYTTYMDLLFRKSALHAAAGLDRRVGELRRYIGSLDQGDSSKNGLAWTGAYGFATNGEERGIFVNENIFHDSSDELENPSRISYLVGSDDSANASKCSKNESGVPGLASFILDKVSPVDERMAGFYTARDDCSDDGRWYWRAGAGDTHPKLHYLTRYGSPGRPYNNWMSLTANSEIVFKYGPFDFIIFLISLLLCIGVFYVQVSIAGARLGGTRIPFILNRSGKSRPNAGTLDFDELPFNHRMVLRASEIDIFKKDAAVDCQLLKLGSAGKLDFIYLQKSIDTGGCKEIKIVDISLLIDDVDQRREMLPLLENFVRENLDVKITLYADYNPLYRLTCPDAYFDSTSTDREVARDTESLRWSSLLSRFSKEYAWSPRENGEWLDWKDQGFEGDLTLSRERRIFHLGSKISELLEKKLSCAVDDKFYREIKTIPAEDIVSLATELGGAYYRKLWEECTHNERVLLYALATGRCVNTLNIAIISHLMRRGLVVMEPSLSLVNESFAEFVREAETPETYQHWESDEQEKGAWQALRVPFMFLLFVPIAILLVVATQELKGGIALMVPILTVIPLLMKGFGLRAPGSS